MCTRDNVVMAADDEQEVVLMGGPEAALAAKMISDGVNLEPSIRSSN